MNKSKRLLSFILVLILSLSTALSYIGTIDVSAGVPYGSAIRESIPTRKSDFSKSGNTGHVTTDGGGIWGFRIGLISTSEFDGNNYGYFTVDKYNSDHIDRISLNNNICSSSDLPAIKSFRGTPDRWYYIIPSKDYDCLYSFYLGGQEFVTMGYGTKSEVVTNFQNILGISDVTDFSAWDTAIQSYDKYGQGHESDDALAELFDPSLKGQYYLIVLEGLTAYANFNAPYKKGKVGDPGDYSKRFILTNYQDFKNDQNRTIAELTGKSSGGMGGATKSAFLDTRNYINQGSVAPFDLEWASGNPIRTGFAVYGDINGENGDPFALNITLEYQGEPNTSVGSKFVSAGSLVKNVSSKSYWGKANKKWVETTDNDEFLQETKKGVDVEDPYAVVFKDYYALKHDAMDISMTKLLDAADTNNRYYGVPGAVGDYVLTWSNVVVTGGKRNIGFSYKPSTLSSTNNGLKYTNTIPVFYSLLIKLADGTTKLDDGAPDNQTAETILESCVQAVTKAFSRTSGDAAGTIYGTDELKLRRGKKLGVSIELVAKGSEIESHKVTVNVAADGSVSSSETWNDKYSSAGSTKANINSGAKCYVVVKNIYRNDANVENALKNLADRDAETLVLAVKNALGGDAFIKFSQKQGGESVCLGCEPKSDADPTLDGYTIYEIEVAGDVSTGAVELPSYMLNRYFQNIIQKSSNPTTKYQVNKDFTRKKSAYSGSTTCGRCSASVEYTTRSEDVKYWKLIWTDTSSGTKHTDYDKGELLGRYFLKMNSGTWEHASRDELVSGVTQNTENWSEPSGYVMDYGFNLIRASVDDIRAISGIANADYASVDADNLLQMKDSFGVVPSSSPKAASGKRDPMAKAGTISDTLTIKSEYDLTKSENGHYEESNKHTHEAFEGTAPDYTDKLDAVSITYYTVNDKVTQGFYNVTTANTANKLEYTFTSTVRKYQTDKIVDGENSKIASSAAYTPISTGASAISDGEVQDGNEYKFANVRYNNIAIHFYPEVKMVSCIGGTDWNSVATKGYSPIVTMGEEKRTSKSSSLYLFKLNRVESTPSVSGTTYTDAAEGGTSIKGSTKVTIPAGSDVYVAADPNGVTVDLYGYTLDCIDATIDATFKTSASTTRNYTDVVKSGENVNTKWHGSANKDTLKAHFETWANDVLNVGNFSADFELYVGGSKKADNFSAVVGRIQRNSTITEEGVYQLQVANGSLVRNDDYSKMIAQIAADYQCSNSEAESIFEASGIYTAILNAIESSNSSFNKSGVCGLNTTWTSQLGNSTNWYDEKVNTFVIRRFTNLNNKIKDITATDKIDFGLAPSSRGGTKQNSNYNNTNGASWKLNVFFNPSIKELLIGGGSYYNPGDASVSIGSANDSHTVLMKGVPVTNADFNISATSTSDFKN